MSLYPANFSDGSRFGRGWRPRYDVQAWHAFRQAVLPEDGTTLLQRSLCALTGRMSLDPLSG